MNNLFENWMKMNQNYPFVRLEFVQQFLAHEKCEAELFGVVQSGVCRHFSAAVHVRNLIIFVVVSFIRHRKHILEPVLNNFQFVRSEVAGLREFFRVWMLRNKYEPFKFRIEFVHNSSTMESQTREFIVNSFKKWCQELTLDAAIPFFWLH